jgi:hypothetical protein
MRLKKLFSHEYLITEVSTEVCDLACFLDIPFNIDDPADHFYIKEPDTDLCIKSFEYRRDSDVLVSSKIFCEILMDIKSGMSVIEAYNKQGYTYT